MIRPILFNTDMVRAILDGRKTVTRRIIKGFIPKDATWGYSALTPNGSISCRGTFAVGYGEKFFKLPCQTGDILYVRETWSTKRSSKCVGNKTEKCPYESCENAPGPCLYDEYIYKATDNLESSDITWHPSIHMPKEAARIWLRVTDVRVERLQEITDEQAEKEGIRGYSKDGKLYKYAVSDNWWIDYHGKHRRLFTGSLWQDMPRTAKEAFFYLWSSTLKKFDLDRYGWDANPWVWVIEFERCEKPEAAGEEKIDGKNKETQIFSEGA